jgi:hypothetical protein
MILIIYLIPVVSIMGMMCILVSFFEKENVIPVYHEAKKHQITKIQASSSFEDFDEESNDVIIADEDEYDSTISPI